VSLSCAYVLSCDDQPKVRVQTGSRPGEHLGVVVLEDGFEVFSSYPEQLRALGVALLECADRLDQANKTGLIPNDPTRTHA